MASIDPHQGPAAILSQPAADKRREALGAQVLAAFRNNQLPTAALNSAREVWSAYRAQLFCVLQKDGHALLPREIDDSSKLTPKALRTAAESTPNTELKESFLLLAASLERYENVFEAIRTQAADMAGVAERNVRVF
jgi:hypothetical protein